VIGAYGNEPAVPGPVGQGQLDIGTRSLSRAEVTAPQAAYIERTTSRFAKAIAGRSAPE